MPGNRAVQRDCQQSLKNSGNSHWLHDPTIQMQLRQFHPIFRSANYERVMPAKFEAMSRVPLTVLTHWGRVTHICVSDLTNIGSDNGLSPGRRQAIIRTNAGILLKRPLGTNFSEILIAILLFSFKKMRLKVSSAKRRPFCRGLNVLMPPS